MPIPRSSKKFMYEGLRCPLSLFYWIIVGRTATFDYVQKSLQDNGNTAMIYSIPVLIPR